MLEHISIPPLGRKLASHEPTVARGSVNVDYLLTGMDLTDIDRFYKSIDYPAKMLPGNLAHVAGLVEGELVFTSIWSSERKARGAFAAMRGAIDAVVADAGPGASLARESHSIQRLLVGEGLEAHFDARPDSGTESVAYVIDLPIQSAHSYNLVCEQMNFPNDFPVGLLLHTVAKSGDVLRAVSVWDRPDQSRRFFEDRLMPAAVEVVREHQVFPEIRPRELELHLFAVNSELFH